MIELITVIAIVCILAALVLGGVQKATQTARTAQCMSILRQWGMAFPLYANDNDGYLPTAHCDSQATQSNWQTNIAPYLIGTVASGPPYQWLRHKFHCPGDTDWVNGWAYATNNYLTTPPGSHPLVNRFTDIPHPQVTLILEEADACGVWTLDPSTVTNGLVDYWHHNNNLANFMFADMHMQSISATDGPAMLAANQILLDPTKTPANQ